MTVLTVIPKSECDEHGVPLDWERCRECNEPWPSTPTVRAACGDCGGHGSLKAAALAHFRARHYRTDCDCGFPICPICSTKAERLGTAYVGRCEGCGHLASEGTWEGRDRFARGDHRLVAYAEDDLRRGHEPMLDRIHYSPCDEGCKHGGPVRGGGSVTGEWWHRATLMTTAGEFAAVNAAVDAVVEASWRSVDVRIINDWAHDLRPENLALLCLRCWAERNRRSD